MPTDELKALEDDSLDLKIRKARGPGFVPMVSLLLAFGAMALSAWLWWEGRNGAAEEASEVQSRLQNVRQAQTSQASEISELRQQLENLAGSSSDAAVRSLGARQAEQAQALAALERTIDSQRAQRERLERELAVMESRLLGLEGELAATAGGASAPEQLDMAAVEYLLRLAPERVTLFGDINSADQALEAADARLGAMDNPVYYGLRRDIAEARQSLEDVSLPNAVALSARIDGIQGHVATLEFSGQGSIADADPADTNDEELGWWDRLVASLSGLVTVRRDEADSASRLTLEEKDLLRQGIWMQLESARLALMRHDQAAWADALQRADGLLKQWFEPSGAAYQAIDKGLGELLAVEVAPELPDVSAPWARLQQISAARSGGVSQPAQTQPAANEPNTPSAATQAASAQSEPTPAVPAEEPPAGSGASLTEEPEQAESDSEDGQ